jgi:hypothetical protein
MVVVALVGFPPGIGLAAEKSTQSASSTNDDEGKSSLTLNGKKLSVAFSRPSTEGKGYQALDKGIEEGFLWRLGKNKATTFETEADLKFGDVEVKAGKYSLAAKKTKDGWDLLVHPEWDRWGSPVPKEGYVATIPLKMGKAKEAAEKLTIDLKEKDGEGHFMLTWGPDTLSTTFKVAG